MAVDPSGDTVASTSSGGDGERGDGAMRLVAGARLGRYRLVRQLGVGGMGVVWSAYDPDLDREVALKLLRSEHDERARARLVREARAMAKLKHPNVIVVYEVASDDARDYIAMELVDGTSLDAWLATKPPRREIVAALLAAGRGLAAAHAAGLIHRDFKPHNVLRGRDGRVLVTDFGLARAAGGGSTIPPPIGEVALDETVDAAAAQPLSHDDAITRTGAFVGTPAYMSPEQFSGGAPDPRTDQFAFCVTAWQALAGARPFQGNTIEALATAVKSGDLNAAPALPRRVRGVLARGLDPDPTRRWPSLDELLAAFERATRSRAPLAIAGAVAVAAIGGGVAFALTRPHAAAFVECDDPAAAFHDTWSSERGEKLGAPVLAAAFDKEQRDWLASLRLACTDASASADLTRARIDCLLDARDRTRAEVALLDTVPRAERSTFDASSLPYTGACEGKPTPPPRPPPVLGDDITKLRVSLARFRHFERGEAKGRDLIDQAKRITWPPMIVEIELAVASKAMSEGAVATARAELRDASAAARDAGLDADAERARVGLVELEDTALEDPADVDELAHALDAAERGVRSTKGPYYQVLALRGWYEAGSGPIGDSITKLHDAREWLAQHGELRRTIWAARHEAAVLMMRGTATDLEEADRVLRKASGMLDEAHHTEQDAELARTLEEVAWRRGALAKLHDLLDRRAAKPAGGARRRGRVVDDDNQPVVGARVVAWQGELVADRERAYVDPHDVPSDRIAKTEAHGEFTIVVPPNGAVIAESDGRRSIPQRVPDGDAPLRLVVTSTKELGLRYEVASIAATRVTAVARYELAPGLGWAEHAQLAEDGHFTLDHLPLAPFKVSLVADIGVPNVRATRTIVMPLDQRRVLDGRSVDIVVRGRDLGRARLYVFVTPQPPRDRADLLVQFASSPDRVEAIARPIGAADATLPGRDIYKRDDLHAAFVAPSATMIAACAAPEAPDDPRFTCSLVGGGDSLELVIEL